MIGDVPTVSYTHLDVYKRQKVRIDEKQITIRYDGNEDLNRLLEMLGGIEEE